MTLHLRNSLSALLFCIAISVNAQQKDFKFNYKIDEELKQRTNPNLHYWFIDPKATRKNINAGKTGTVRIIVRLKSDPIAASSESGRARAQQTIDHEHELFKSGLSALVPDNHAGRSAGQAPSVIHFEYKEVFNGFAISTDASLIDRIKKLPNVTSVSEDKQVSTYDETSNGLIKVPEVWANVGVTGKNITIGIIDTGVDYNHPSLGGGLGSSFKVVGGYDFINNDSDPMDDNGHGTHVAGIAAANGASLKGVAPDAKIYAFKALDQYGYGQDSQILAAIERCADPDQNPATDDALKVVNMSLGRSPDANEPLSEAVNNAVGKGVTFVIAAGNNYQHFTIGTPGIAQQAITVGAVDSYFSPAVFTSKGPVQKTFYLKPDVAAPGVDIFSTFTNNQFKFESGTSMASPHVAGVVALILEKHPQWTPDMLKAVLMNTANYQDGQFWEKGAGVIDALDAITSSLILSPGSISFGAVDNTVATWVKDTVLTVVNTGTTQQSLSIEVEGTILDPAISISITPSSVTLLPGEEKQVAVKLSVNTSALAAKNLPDAYTGSIVAKVGDSTFKTALTLANPQITQLRFTGELPSGFIVIGIEGNYYWQPYTPSGEYYDLYLPYGKYDIITQYYGNRTVITEGVSTSQNVTIELDKSQAKNQILLKPVDKNGNAIDPNINTLGGIYFSGRERNIVTIFSAPEDTLYISDQKSYGYDFKLFHKPSEESTEYYEILGGTGYGINNNLTVSNATTFTSFEISNPSVPINGKQNITYYVSGGPITVWTEYPFSISNPATIHRSQFDSTHFTGSYVKLWPVSGMPGYNWETPVWRTLEQNQLVLMDRGGKPLTMIADPNFKYILGKSLLRLNASTSNYDNRIQFTEYPSTGLFNRFYGERENGTVTFELTASGSNVKSGVFPNRTMDSGGPFNIIEMDSQPVPHILRVSYDDFQVGGRFAKAEAVLEFDLGMDDKNPPSLEYLSIETDGVSTNEILKGEAASLKLKIKDECTYNYYCNTTGIAQVVVEIRKMGTQLWSQLTLLQDGAGQVATLSSTLDSGYYALRITATDFANNKFTHLLEPGFLIGPPSKQVPYATVVLLTPESYGINAGVKPNFTWTPLPDAKYRMQLSAKSDFSLLEEDVMVNKNEHQLQQELKKDSIYYWRVQALYADSEVPWSKVGQFKASLLPAATLLSPVNGQEDVAEEPVLLTWEKANGANQYHVEMAEDANFSFPMLNTFLFDTATTILTPSVSRGKTYYWRVTAYYYTFSTTYAIPSEVFTFKTLPVIIGVDEEGYTTKQLVSYPNPFSGVTRIELHASKAEDVLFKVVNSIGEHVRSSTYHLAPGLNVLEWDGKNDSGVALPEGLYIGQLQGKEKKHHIKMVLKH